MTTTHPDLPWRTGNETVNTVTRNWCLARKVNSGSMYGTETSLWSIGVESTMTSLHQRIWIFSNIYGPPEGRYDWRRIHALRARLIKIPRLCEEFLVFPRLNGPIEALMNLSGKTFYFFLVGRSSVWNQPILFNPTGEWWIHRETQGVFG